MTLELIIRRIGAGLALFVLAMLMAACSRQETPRERVTVAAVPILRSATLMLAASETAAGNGLDLQIKRVTTGVEGANTVLQGEADFASVAEFGFVGLQFKHPELRIVAVLTRVDAMEVMARRDRNISKPSDLRGKSIGVAANTDAEFYLYGFLLAHGLRADDVRITHLPPEQISASLLSGKVDAVCTWEPNTYDLRQRLGDQVLAWSAQEGQDGYWLLVTTEKLLKDKPEIATRLLHAIHKAEQNLHADPGTYRERLQALTGSPAAVQEATWKNYQFALSLPQDLLVAMEAGARWRMTTGMTPKQPVPNYAGNIDTKAMDAVLPAAVTLIR